MRIATVAVVGGESLMAREVRDVLSRQATNLSVKLIAGEDDSAILTELGGEPAVIATLDTDSLASAEVVVLAGTPASSRKAFEFVSTLPKRPGVIDLSYALEDRPEARLWAPLVEPPNQETEAGAVHIIAHPAATVLAAFAQRLHQHHPVRRWVAHVFAPASERGRSGIAELQQQTTQLLSLQSLPKKVFDEQLAFNLLARYGSDAPDTLQAIEARIERHLTTLLSEGGGVPMPSIRVIQVPVFHGHSFSVWAEFDENPGSAALLKALASEQIEVRTRDEEPPTNVGVTGQSGMTVGLIETDRNHARAAWFWIVADNHRTAADNAVCMARLLVPGEGRA